MPDDVEPSDEARRIRSAFELMEAGLEIRAQKLRSQGLSEAEVRARMVELANAREEANELRVSPERLEKLRLREPD